MKTIDQELKTSFANNKFRLITNLIFTSNWFQHNYMTILKPHGVSIQQYNVLRILKGANDWMTMHDLKSRMIDKTPNATRLSDKLLDKGYVERKRSDEDRRVVYLKISEKGLEFVAALDKLDYSDQMSFMDKITEEEAETFSKILDKMRS